MDHPNFVLKIWKEITERDGAFSQTGHVIDKQHRDITVSADNPDFGDENLRFSGYLYNDTKDVIGIIISCNQSDIHYIGWIDYALMPKQWLSFCNGDDFLIRQEWYSMWLDRE